MRDRDHAGEKEEMRDEHIIPRTRIRNKKDILTEEDASRRWKLSSRVLSRHPKSQALDLRDEEQIDHVTVQGTPPHADKTRTRPATQHNHLPSRHRLINPSTVTPSRSNSRNTKAFCVLNSNDLMIRIVSVAELSGRSEVANG